MAFKQFLSGDLPFMRGRWPLLFAALLAAAFVWYFFGVKDEYPRAASWSGMAMGIIAFLLMIFLISYKIRKHVYTVKLGMTSSWLSAHLYLGVLAALLALMHSGLSPAAGFNTFLFVVFLLTTISGVVGGLIFQLNPIVLSKAGKEVVLKSQLAEAIARKAEEYEKEMEGMSDKYRSLYKNRVKPLIPAGKVKWGYLFTSERELVDKRKAYFEKLKDDVPNEEKYHFSTLGSQMLEVERLAFKLVKLEVMDIWLAFHMPLSGVAVTAVIFHIFTVWYY